MIVKFSKNLFKQTGGIVFNNWGRLLCFILFSATAFILFQIFEYRWIALPVIPISILGGALAIFLGFRNSSAYDRWWEGRKIWGKIVNSSRSFGMSLLSYSSLKYVKGGMGEKELKEWQKEMIYRHIGWTYALKSRLRKENYCSELRDWLPKKDLIKLKGKANIPTQINHLQGQEIKYAQEIGFIEDFRQYELVSLIREFYDHQGAAERIKNTVFPYYYDYFTRLFMWLFTISLPFSLVDTLGWMTIPMCVAISFCFSILEKSGSITEQPFEGRAADIPMRTLCRTIEIDLLEMLDEENIPDQFPIESGKFDVTYQL